MKNKKTEICPTTCPKVFPIYIVNLFFFIGLFSALCFRSILILDKTIPELVRPVWYMSVIGYIFFFAYRWIVTERRRKYVHKTHIIDKLKSDQKLNENDRAIMLFLLNSLSKSRENLNYLAIFILSIIAIIIDILVK